MQPTRLDRMLEANLNFQQRIDVAKLPSRAPDSLAVITCMDPRINLEALGIVGFSAEGEGNSDVRVIRTLGAAAEARSLLVGIFLAGFKEIVVLMHTDCGCCLAWSKIDVIVENMESRVGDSAEYQQFKREAGEPFRDNLRTWLNAFEDPRSAIHREVAAIKALPFVPDDIVVHGLLYDVATGGVEVIVNGY